MILKRARMTALFGLCALFGSPAVLADETAAWTLEAAMPTARSEIAAATLEGRLYVAGGMGLFGGLTEFEAYNPEADAWSQRASLPERRHHSALVALAGRIYAIGGYGGRFLSDPSDSVWAYEPDRDSWTVVAPLPSPRAAHAAVVLNGKIFVVGGIGPGARELWIYDPEKDLWADSGTRLPSRR